MSGGTKYDDDKPPMAYIPVEALEAEARVWGYGAGKYTLHNWRKGFQTLRVCSAAMRHLTAIIKGQDYDPETGLPHAAHVRCCMAMLIAQLGRVDLDDRWRPDGDK